ncbi:MAG: DNA mismatch repair protein MutS [Gammaproteobacteria bacterium]|nr:MAG: DNA mismatch repair protein MutS [Gammaproteobacteria bacterium]
MSEQPPSDEEVDLFRAAVGPVRPVRNDRVEPERTPPPARPLKLEQDEAEVMRDALSDHIADTADLQPGDILAFCREGVQKKVFRKLRTGAYAVQDEIDLHGMTRDEARRALQVFLRSAAAEGRRCVRVIHGKGLRSRNEGPVLKTRVDHWLRQMDEVLAFHSALPRHGGTGAVYVLLKRG